MVINLAEMGQLVVIAGAAGAGVKYVIIRPLQNAIMDLNKSIIGLNVSIDALKNEQHGIDKRLGIAEEQIKVANHRIGDLEEVVHK